MPRETFYSATPRFGVQAPALDNVIPVTTDPRELSQGNPILTGYGINSFYGGVATYREQSFSGPAAAAMATVAVRAYQDENGGENPSIQQIKSAMLSGMTYISQMFGGEGIDTVYGVSAPDTFDEGVEYFVTTDPNTNDLVVNRYDVDNLRLFRLTQVTFGSNAGATTLNVDDALFAVGIDSFGTMIYGFYSETVPVEPIASLLVNGQNKDESFDIAADVPVTVNAAGGADYIVVTAPAATINAGSGNDTVYTGNTGSYYAEMGAGTNSYFGGNGTDYVLLTSGATDTIFLGGGNDTVDALYDFGDDDYINGGGGTDTLLIWAGLFRTFLVSIEEVIEV